MSIWNFLAKLFGGRQAPVVPDSPTSGPTRPPPPDVNLVILQLFEEHNACRRSSRLQPLVISEPLNQAAQKHADHMAASGVTFHGTPREVMDRVRAEKFVPRAVGENVAAGQPTVSTVMDSWTGSTEHLANILNEAYWNVGFGMSQGRDGRLFWCVVFATPFTRNNTRPTVVVRTPPPLVERW